MFKNNSRNSLVLLVGIAVFLYAEKAVSVTQSVTAHINFDTPVSLTKNSDINFGTLSSGTADTYTITSTGAVTAAGPGAHVSGSTTAGDITIVGSATQTIDISAGNYTSDNGVTLQNATCSYDGGAAGPCAITGAQAPSGSGKSLLIGVQAVTDGTQTAGTSAAPGFTISVTYL